MNIFLRNAFDFPGLRTVATVVAPLVGKAPPAPIQKGWRGATPSIASRSLTGPENNKPRANVDDEVKSEDYLRLCL